MSANADAARAMYAAFSELARGADVETYVATHWDPACEYHPVEEAEPILGREAMVDWNRRWFEVWDVLEAHPAKLVEVGETVVVRVELEGRGGESGVQIAQHFFHVIDVRDGRIARMREFQEENEALAAAGLGETAP